MSVSSNVPSTSAGGREKECFVPWCKNSSSDKPNKVFVRIREDLKAAWCRQVKAQCYNIFLMYCCEDHLDLKEDLKNFHKWNVMGDEPKLKPTAKLRNIPEAADKETVSSSDTCERESCMQSTSMKDSELEKLLLCPTENTTRKKRRLTESIIPCASSTCTHPEKVKVDAVTQVQVKMVDKSTNYRARKLCSCTTDLVPAEDHLSPLDTSMTSSASLFGCTTETETTSHDQDSNKDFVTRETFLNIVLQKPKMYLGVPHKFLWIIDYIISKSSIKVTYLCLVISLLKIKQNDSVERISDQVQLSKARISTLIAMGVQVLGNFFQNLVYMPTALQIKKKLPLVFKIRYSNVQMIIDCFEIQIEKPSDPIKQAQTWSQYKNCNTIKYLIGSTPNGFINFISAGYGGRISDKTLVIESHLLDILPINGVVMADRGFKEVESLLMTKGVKLLRPPSVFAGQKLTDQDVIKSKTIASLRVHIERVIRRVREFKFLKPHAVVHSKHVAYLDEVVMIACGLINLQNEIIKKY